MFGFVLSLSFKVRPSSCEQALWIFTEETEHSENKPALFCMPDNISKARILDNIRNFFTTELVPNLFN